MSERFNNPGAGLPVEPSPGPVKPELPPAVHIQPPGVSKPFPDAKIKIETETESKFISSEALKNAAHLQAADRSYESLTVGSLKVIGDMDAGPIHSLHTHIQTVQGAQLKLSAEFSKIYQELSSDGVISSAEKQILKKELEVIKAEYPIVIRKAEENKRADTEVAEYKRAYEKLISFLYDEIRIFDDMDKPLEIERGQFNGFFAAYYKARTALQVNKDGKDGSTKFLPGLETAGEYENQIGTYQGQLYRWTGSKWELLNAVMPLNPAVHYDFENTDFDEEKAKRELKEAEEKKEKTKEAYERAAADLKKLQEEESNLRNQLEKTKTRLKETELELVGHPLNEDLFRLLALKDRLEKAIKELETQLKNLNPKLESAKRHAAEAKKEKEAAEKAYNAVKFKEYKLLDVSGNNRHAVFNGVIKKEKTPVGAAFHFDGTNELKYKTPDFMKAGKNRTHSRWFKIDDLTTEENNYLWFYGGSDRAWFDTGSIEMEIADVYSWILFEDLKENGWNHLAVSYNFKDNSTEVILYLNGKKYRVNEDGRRNYPLPDFCFEMSGDDWRFAEGSLSNLLFFDRVLTEQEILWLYLNPQYPVKNYTLADWQIDAENGDSVLKDVVPKYLGVTETVPETEDVLIVKGEQLGKRKARAGDWVLMSRTVGGWEQGVCYRWTGGQWIALKPEHRFTDCYQAALYHIFEIPELANKTGHFGALFAKVLVAQKAMVEFLSANKAFIEDLTANKTFIKKLTASKLEIDTDENSHYDFEAWFDSIHGLKINNEGKTIFSVSPKGDVFMKSDKLIVPVMDKDPSDIKVGEIWVRSDL